MVIASSETEDGTFLLLGLSAENVKRLQAGQPVRVSRESHGLAMPNRLVIAIVVGESEEAIGRDLRKAGLIGANTVVNQEKTF